MAETGADHILITGVPGFLGSRLLDELARTRPRSTLLAGVERRCLANAEATLRRVGARARLSAGQWQCRAGDITRPGLGLDPAAVDAARATTICFHLAAVYDLTMSAEVGDRVNVAGTRNVLDTLVRCPRLKRLHYVSTAYVSGTAIGTYTEDMFDVGQGFKNAYEWSKFRAEGIVRDRAGSIPTTIYRPAIVVGDSVTGAIPKLDGPYPLLRLMRHLPRWTILPRIGTGRAEINLVPVDFVVGAIAWLSRLDRPSGQTYHLVDPQPLTSGDLMSLVARARGQRGVWIHLSPIRLKRLVRRHPRLARWARVCPEVLDYPDHPVHYDCRHATHDLIGSPVRCPRLPDYLPALLSRVE